MSRIGVRYADNKKANDLEVSIDFNRKPVNVKQASAVPGYLAILAGVGICIMDKDQDSTWAPFGKMTKYYSNKAVNGCDTNCGHGI